jgi:Na+-driven multidrug efflux pump
MNLLLGALEPTGVATAVFGVYFKLQSFVILPVVGMTHGMMPIVSYNLGAEKKSRMLSAYRYCTYYSFGYLCLCSALMFAIPGVLIGFFSPTPAMLALGKPALRIIAVGYLFTAYSLVNSSFFQALGRSVLSMVMSIARQLGFLVPLAIFFAFVFGLEAVWWAIPMAEFGVLVVAIFGRIRINKRVINLIPDSENVNNIVQI